MKKQPLLTPILWWFMIAMVLANIAGSMLPLLLPLYLSELGASVGQVGLVFTLTSFAILGLQVFGGYLSDSIGRLRAIALGSIGGILGYSAMLLSPSWQWMLAALVIYQIPYALVGPSFSAFIAENSSEENRGRVYGITGTIYSVTGIIGPPLGGFLAAEFGFKTMLLAAAALYALAAGLRIWMATTMRSAQERPATAVSFSAFKSSMTSMAGFLFAGGLLTWIFVSDGVADIAFRLSSELQPLYLEQVGGISLQQIGLLGSLNAIAGMFVPMLSGRLADKHGERVPIVMGFGLCFLALLVFLSAHDFLSFAGSWVIFGLGGGLLGPAYQSLISKVVPANRLGAFNGLFYGSMGLVSLPAPWLGAQLWERFSPRTPFILTTIACLAVTPLIWMKFRAPEKKAEAVEPAVESTVEPAAAQ